MKLPSFIHYHLIDLCLTGTLERRNKDYSAPVWNQWWKWKLNYGILTGTSQGLQGNLGLQITTLEKKKTLKTRNLASTWRN